MNEQDTPVLTQLQDRVLTVTLNRPQFRNAMNGDLNLLLHKTISQAAKDDKVGAIVLTGAGKDFCVGGDVKQLAAKTPEEKRRISTERLLQLGAETAMLLHQMPKPTIAMVRGAAAGDGLSLAAACDFRYAEQGAKFGFAYGKVGLSGSFGGGYFVQLLLGPAKAREFCLLAPIIGAEEAARIGLVSRCVPAAELEEVVQAVALQLAQAPAEALGRIKQNLNCGLTKLPWTYLRREIRNFMRCRSSAEHEEAINAFVEKREPVFHRPE